MTELDEKELRKQIKNAIRTPSEHRAALRRKVRYFYDLQRLRMQAGGRNKVKEGGATPVELNEIDLILLERRSAALKDSEKIALKDVEDHLKTDKFYREILSDKSRFKGIGPTLAGVLLSEIDINRCPTISSLWKYAGLAPIPAQRCKKCQQHLNDKKGELHHPFTSVPKGCDRVVPMSATFASAKTMKPTKGEKLPYNAFLKTKLMGVMTMTLLTCGSPYRKFYDDYKHRKASAGWGISDGHRHQAAMRYMIKMVLLDIWMEWRQMEGLPVREPYQEQYLGHKHSA